MALSTSCLVFLLACLALHVSAVSKAASRQRLERDSLDDAIPVTANFEQCVEVTSINVTEVAAACRKRLKAIEDDSLIGYGATPQRRMRVCQLLGDFTSCHSQACKRTEDGAQYGELRRALRSCIGNLADELVPTLELEEEEAFIADKVAAFLVNTK